MPSIHQGHRARMRERFLQFGADAMQTHELLEILLYFILPQKDTNPLSHALLNRFGSLKGIYEASREELLSVSGVGERVADMLLSSLHAAEKLVYAPEWENKGEQFDDYGRLGAHLVSYFSKTKEATTVAVLLDAKMRLIEIFEVAKLDFGSAGVRAAGIAAQAAKLSASIVVLAHNHPFGPVYPTHADIVSLALIDGELTGSGIFLLEHYIVSGRSFVGYHKRFSSNLPSGSAVHNFVKSKEAAAKT